MMDHNEQLLDLMDSPFFEHKVSVGQHNNNSMPSLTMDGNLPSIPTGSPLLSSGLPPFGAYTFLDANDDCLSPSSPVTDASIHSSSSPNHLPLSPQSEHPFTEALGGQGTLFLSLSGHDMVGVNDVSSSLLPLSPLPTNQPTVTVPSSSSLSGTGSVGAARKRKSSSSSSAATSNKTSSRSKGRRTDSPQEASSAATASSKARKRSTTKKSTVSGGRSTRSRAISPLVPTPAAHGDDKTSLSAVSSSIPSSPIGEVTSESLPLLEAVTNQPQDITSTTSSTTTMNVCVMSTPMDAVNAGAPPAHMVAALGGMLHAAGAVTLAQPEYERMLQEEERQKEKKMRKAEQARISRQKKKDRMAQLEETVAIYKQQIAHLQTAQPNNMAMYHSNSNGNTNVMPLPVPSSTAERKNSSPTSWPNSPAADTTSSNDDTRSIQSGDDSSPSSSSSSTTSLSSSSPSQTANDGVSMSGVSGMAAAEMPSNAGQVVAATPDVTSTTALPMLSSLPAPSPVCVEDEVNGEAIQRSIQSIINASYASRQPGSSSHTGLMAAVSVHQPCHDTKDGTSNGNELTNQIQGLFDMFAKRAKVTEQHLDSLDKLLVPSMPLRFLEWSLTQNDKFYSDPNGLWHCLWAKTLALSTEQMTSLASLRNDVMTQRAAEAEIRMQALSMTGTIINPTANSAATTTSDSNANNGNSGYAVTSISPQSLSLSSTLSLQAAYSQLSALSRLHVSSANRWLRTLASILTPLQLARYFEWVNIYGHICVQINV